MSSKKVNNNIIKHRQRLTLKHHKNKNIAKKFTIRSHLPRVIPVGGYSQKLIAKITIEGNINRILISEGFATLNRKLGTNTYPLTSSKYLFEEDTSELKRMDEGEKSKT